MDRNDGEKKLPALILATIVAMAGITATIVINDQFVGTASAANLSDMDSDQQLDSGSTFWQGQTLALEGNTDIPRKSDSNDLKNIVGGDTVQIRRVNSNNELSGLESEFNLNSQSGFDGTQNVSTSNLDASDYVLTDGDNTSSILRVDINGKIDERGDASSSTRVSSYKWEIAVQNLDASFASGDTPANVGDVVTIELSSNRGSFTVNISESSLSESDLGEIFNASAGSSSAQFDNGPNDDSQFVNGSDSDNDPNDNVQINTNSDGEIIANFSNFNESGSYTFDLKVNDTTAEASASIEVGSTGINTTDETPRYNFTITNNGDTYTLGYPGPVNGSIRDTFINGMDGIAAVYEYDTSTDEWVQIEGNGLDKSPSALDAIIIVTEGNTGPDKIDLRVRFETQEFAEPSSKSLSEGWNFVAASKFDDSDTVFTSASSDVTVVLDRFPGGDSKNTQSVQNFSGQIDTRNYYTNSGNPPTVSPFKGYFIFVSSDGLLPSVVSGVQNRTDSDTDLGVSST